MITQKSQFVTAGLSNVLILGQDLIGNAKPVVFTSNGLTNSPTNIT